MPGNKYPRGLLALLGIYLALIVAITAWNAQPYVAKLAFLDTKESYYNLLVQSLRAGHLDLNKQAPPGLAKLSDPYDPALNAPYIVDVFDLSYYKGKFYLYFGITPALVLFWPYAALTGHYLPDKAALIIFFTVGIAAAADLLLAIWRRYAPQANIWLAVTAWFVLSLAVALTLWCNVYEVVLISGFAFVMLALAALWRAWHQPRHRAMWLALASLAYGLAIGSRPSLLFGGVILVMPVIQAWREAKDQASYRQAGWLLAAAVGPIMLIGIGLMFYNDLRFGSPFEFGWRYQLNMIYEPTTARQFSLHYLWFNLRYYFLEPIRWHSQYPYFQKPAMTAVPSGYSVVQVMLGDPYNDLLTGHVLILLVLAVPLIWRGRPNDEVSFLRWFVTAVGLQFVICALTICSFFSASDRYEFDFLPAWLLLGLMGILGLERALATLPVVRNVARCFLFLMLAGSAAFNILANVEPHAEANSITGDNLLFQEDVDGAVARYRKALAIWPHCADAFRGLGNAFLKTGEIDDAIDQYQRALQINPKDVEALNNLGNCFLQKGRLDDAMAEYQKALEINPNSPEARGNLGFCLLQTGRVDEAIVQYQKAIELKPDFAGGYNNLGNAFRLKGMPAQAIAAYQKALKIQPQFIQPQMHLAWMLAAWPDPAIRNGAEAVALAQNADQLSGDTDPQVLRTLAAAYAEAGRFPDAVLTAKKALALADSQSNTILINYLQEEIGLYEKNSPCRSAEN